MIRPDLTGKTIIRGAYELKVLAHYFLPEELMVEQTDPLNWPDGGRFYLIPREAFDAWQAGRGPEDPDEAERRHREGREL